MSEIASVSVFGYLEVSSPWEVLPILVEGDCHHPVGRVERFLYSIAMVNVNVNIQHTLMVSGMGSGARERWEGREGGEVRRGKGGEGGEVRRRWTGGREEAGRRCGEAGRCGCGEENQRGEVSGEWRREGEKGEEK